MVLQFHRWLRNWCWHSEIQSFIPDPMACITFGCWRHSWRCLLTSPGMLSHITWEPRVPMYLWREQRGNSRQRGIVLGSTGALEEEKDLRRGFFLRNTQNHCTRVPGMQERGIICSDIPSAVSSTQTLEKESLQISTKDGQQINRNHIELPRPGGKK